MAYPGRTTAELVGAIVDVDPSVSDLSPFIDAANELVTELCLPVGYTDTRLELIERWLSAHFYCILDPRSASEQAGANGGTVSQSFQYKVGLMLAVTTYGQQAMMLDTQGALSIMSAQAAKGDNKRKVGVLWVGKEPCDPNPNHGFEPFP